MAGAVVAQPGPAGDGAVDGAAGAAAAGGGGMMGMAVRLGLLYLAMSMFGGKKSDGAAKDATVVTCNFNRSAHVDIDVYVHSKQQTFGQPVWSYSDQPLVTDYPLTTSLRIGVDTLGPAIAQNSSMWLTTRFTEARISQADGSSASAVDVKQSGGPRRSFYKQTELIRHRAPKAKRDTKSLLGDDADAEEAPAAVPEPPALLDGADAGAIAEAAKPWKAFWKPNVTISVVDDFQALTLEKMPPHLLGKVQLERGTLTYYPVVEVSEFWLLKDYWVELNDTVTEVDLHLEFNKLSNMMFQFQHAISQSFDMQTSGGMMKGDEQDEIKRVFLEGNPYLLALTTVVSLLHTVFDMLAFKNDIGFWKSNKSMEGLSARSIIINAFCQLVIFFYLLDNETSFVILLSAGVGTLIEFWKVTKAMDVSIQWTDSGLPKLSVKDRGSYVDSNTQQYDKEAMRYLSWVMYPAIFIYCCYSLVYDKHKSWYSWVLGSGVGCVYAFGFMLMCPQLYLNYKLKSVAHLPWRQMSYKFLNTIIDDLFAFVIKMPLLHRLSVFRDDLVFLVYIYQRWIYRVDMKRVNEFGFVGEDPNADDAALEGAQPAALTSGPADEGVAGAADGAAQTGRKDAKKSKVPKADAKAAAASSSKDK